MFYVYQKYDGVLAVMNHAVLYPDWFQESARAHLGEEEYHRLYETYQEVVVILIDRDSQIQTKDEIIIQKPIFEGGGVK